MKLKFILIFLCLLQYLTQISSNLLEQNPASVFDMMDSK